MRPTKCSILRGPLNSFTSSAEMNPACGKVLPPSGGKTLGRRTCGGTKCSILRGPHLGDWRGNLFSYSRPSNSSIQRLLTESLGIRLVGASSVSLPPAFWPEVARSAAPPLPTKFIILRGLLKPFTSSAEMNPACGKVLPPSGQNAWTPHLRRHKIFDFAGAPFGRLAGETFLLTRGPPVLPATGRPRRRTGIRQSPRGDRATEPTLGPSARQERLNCWEKKRR